jgi:hypothetical protein
MHDNPLDQENLSQAALEHEVELLDQRIVRALETVPDLHMPADFAVRVASLLPARRPVSLTPTHYGQNAMLIGMVVTLAALLALATLWGFWSRSCSPSSSHSPYGLASGATVCAS